ncbi:MAG: VOC family protein [Myxococcota bacterium]|nr:VOC family protein [Myxococcota bacterium]
MRLRQIALMTDDLEKATSDLTDLLESDVCFRDPGVALFGLRNVLIPLGSDFLEVLAPEREDTAGGRHLKRRGPGGYMIIFHCADGTAAREHALQAGARAVWQHDESGIHATHFHPSSLPGAIVSVDSMEESNSDYCRPDARWHWAGPDWKKYRRDNGILGLSGAVIQAPDPDGAAARWREVLDLPSSENRSHAAQLDMGELLFEPGPNEDAFFTAFKLRHNNIPRLLARAEDQGLSHDENGVNVAGIRIELEAAAP